MKLALVFVLVAFFTTQASAETGLASWYQMGTKTANGEHYHPDGMTAAHRSLPFGTVLSVSYNGRNVTVRINDRGPFIRSRQFDLSRGAAKALKCSGVCRINYHIRYKPLPKHKK